MDYTSKVSLLDLGSNVGDIEIPNLNHGTGTGTGNKINQKLVKNILIKSQSFDKMVDRIVCAGQ